MRTAIVLTIMSIAPLAGCIGGTAYPAIDVAAGVVAMGAMVAAGDRASSGPASRVGCDTQGDSATACGGIGGREAGEMLGWVTPEQRNAKFAADFDEHFDKSKQEDSTDTE